jgi:hypothetical protein
MTIDADLPPELAVLFPNGDPAGRTLSVPLPPGRIVGSARDGRPTCWYGEGPVPAGLFSELLAAHPRSGLWPLLLLGAEPAGPTLWPEDGPLPQHDPIELLAGWWTDLLDFNDKVLSHAERSALSISTAEPWPGPAPAGESGNDPDRQAQAQAEAVVAGDPSARLLLVPADRGASALIAVGWVPTDDDDRYPDALAAVVQDWETRFGARVVSIDAGTLNLSVAAPPVTIEHAMRVAVEHFAFCPEFNEAGVTGYAETIVGQPHWSFWWD